MSFSKDRHYWTQLRLALTSGQWSSKYPAKEPNGTALPWSELFRKFNKHCRGFQDVAQVASQTHALALLLAANSRDEDQDDLPIEGDGIYPIELGQECILPEERIEEAGTGYEALRNLKSSNFDSLNFALAYYAYALGNPSQCLSHLREVPELLSLEKHIPSESDAATRSSTATGHIHHLGLYVPSFSTSPSLSSAGGSFASLADSSTPELKDGRAWAMTETLRSVCLQGMSHERLSPVDSDIALETYGNALPLLNTLNDMFPDPSKSSAPAVNLKIFLQHRELWRWVERLLWRATIVSARTSGAETQPNPKHDIWTWLFQYSTCSIYWPATFRTAHRSAVSVIYFRALIVRHHPTHTLSSRLDSRSSTPTQAHSQTTTTAQITEEKPWLHTARTVVNDYRAILSACTTFPRAGERNIRVEDFVDLSVGIWEAGGASGEGVGWVLDILWWATRLTFNSHRILRHMTRLLHASGDTPLARRTLLLYSQIVGKAYEASHASSSPPSSKSSSSKDLSSIDVDAASDSDSDKAWVETLVAGARMLCRYSASQIGLEGLKEAREAGVCIKRARTRLHADEMKLTASVDLAEGVWNFVMVLKEQDPHTRPGRFAAAHILFLRACGLSTPTDESSTSIDVEPAFLPDPAAFYHLALSFAHPGPTHDLTQAILYAGRAVEGDPPETRYWHLFGLLLAAAEKWGEAREILDRGAAIDEDDGVTEEDGEDEGEGEGEGGSVEGDTLKVPGNANGVVQTKVHGRTEIAVTGVESSPTSSVGTLPLGNGQANGHQNGDRTSLPATPPKRILLVDGARIPSAAALLAPAQDHPSPSKQERLEHALQLRMTQGALTEVVEGAEGAEQKWLEVFSWVAAMKASGIGEPTPRPSMDGRPLTEKAPSFVASRSAEEHALPAPDAQLPARLSSSSEPSEKREALLPSPIPITVLPATPDNEQPPQRDRRKRLSTSGKRSSSVDRDTSKSKKMQQMLKNRVHKGRARVSTISRRIGNGVARTGSLKRSNSTPDFHAILRQTSYQASSIHSRRRITSILHHPHDRPHLESPPPVPVPPPLQPQDRNRNTRTARGHRLMADLWLMSAATFRRLGKIEQAKGSIQEAEVRDEGNPGVWVQLGLYYVALGHQEHAMGAFQKALFINPDDVSASVHLARLHLNIYKAEKANSPGIGPSLVNVDLAAGMLGHLTRGNGWDVPEAWYYLAKAYGMQGRKNRERECLDFALTLSASRGIREIGAAVGWCI